MQEQILLFFQRISTPLLDSVGQLVTMAGEQILFIAVISYIFWNVSKPAGCALTYTLMASSLLNGVLKLVFHTARPYLVLEGVEGKRVSTAEGFAFPIGHTQGAATFFASLSQYLGRRRYTAAALLLSALVGLSRIYLGVHWPVDVLGGYLLGLITALLLYRISLKLFSSPSSARRTSLLTGIAATALLLISLIIDAAGAVPEGVLTGMIKLLAITGGFSLGSFFERGQLDFTVTGTQPQKLLRYILGLFGAMIILYGLKLILPDVPLTTALRYLGAGFWAFYLYPIIGSKLSIDRAGTKLFAPAKLD